VTEAACKSVGRLLGAHLDGQLDAVKTLEVEDHLTACEPCRERLALDRAIRGSLKKAVSIKAPDDVRARMLAAIAGEASREERQAEERAAEDTRPLREQGMLRRWRTALPLASAAAIALAWGFAGKQPVIHGTPEAIGKAGFANDDLLRDFVTAHSKLPPESADPKQVRNVERYVGVPVHVPRIQQDARFVGWRLVQVRGGDNAAMLQYEMQQGQRVTIFVYNARNVRVGRNDADLAPRAIGTAQVRVGQANGYSVAVTEHGDVGYTIASDLDPEQSAKLVAVVDHQQQ
jgi:anti-sigma factor RsiW